MGSESDGSGIVGQQGLNSATSEYNQVDFQIDQAFAKISTVKIVKVIAVSNNGGLSPVGNVDVQPLVNLVDGLLGSSMQHGTIFGVPYFRLQGGKNAIIMDPIVGDIGFMVCADRDISSVKNAKSFANPGSFRRFSMADGIYVGGILNGVPEQYIQFNDNGITIADKNGNKIETKSDGVHFNKDIFVNGVSFENHVHSYLKPTSGATTPTPTGTPTS